VSQCCELLECSDTVRWATGRLCGLTYICHSLWFVISFLRAGVQPTLDPYAEAFCDRPIALTQEGRSLVDDVYECVHD